MVWKNNHFSAALWWHEEQLNYSTASWWLKYQWLLCCPLVAWINITTLLSSGGLNNIYNFPATWWLKEQLWLCYLLVAWMTTITLGTWKTTITLLPPGGLNNNHYSSALNKNYYPSILGWYILVTRVNGSPWGWNWSCLVVCQVSCRYHLCWPCTSLALLMASSAHQQPPATLPVLAIGEGRGCAGPGGSGMGSERLTFKCSSSQSASATCYLQPPT